MTPVTLFQHPVGQNGRPAVTKYLIDKGYKNFALVTAINDEYSGLSNYFRAAQRSWEATS